jgi:hypothetical protein
VERLAVLFRFGLVLDWFIGSSKHAGLLSVMQHNVLRSSWMQHMV